MKTIVRFTATILVVACVLLQSSCKNDQTTQSSNANLAGTWKGTGTDNSPGGTPASITATLTQDGTTVNGTLTAVDQTGFTTTGSISGTVLGNSFQGQFSAPRQTCQFNLALALQLSGTKLSGTYSPAASNTCTDAKSGQLSLTKQ